MTPSDAASRRLVPRREEGDKSQKADPTPTAATCAGRAFEIDAGRLAEEARFDGIFVLRTNARMTPLNAVLKYRELLLVEDLFRRAKVQLRRLNAGRGDDRMCPILFARIYPSCRPTMTEWRMAKVVKRSASDGPEMGRCK